MKYNFENIRRLHKHHLPRYLLAGGTAVVVEYSIFYFLYHFQNVEFLIANTLSYIVGWLTSFVLNRGWTFNTGTYKKAGHHQAIMYGTLAVFNLFMTNLIVGGLKYLGLDPLLGKIVALATIATWNFFIFRGVIFATDSSASTRQKIDQS
jgi:putative flippase GtrA